MIIKTSLNEPRSPNPTRNVGSPREMTPFLDDRATAARAKKKVRAWCYRSRTTLGVAEFARRTAAGAAAGEAGERKN